MPGIAGFIRRRSDVDANDKLLQKVLDALEPEPLFRKEWHAGADVSLGRASLAIVNQALQPAWNPERTIALVLEGELHEKQSLRRRLRDTNRLLPEHDDAALLVALYEKEGASFISELNGNFVLALWDDREKRLLLANDRLGLHPLYYVENPDGFYFASGVRALLAVPGTSRCIDPVGIAQFLTFDHLLHEHTLLESVKLLPQASIAMIEGGQLSIEPYWHPFHCHTYELRDEEEWMDAMMANLRRAVARQAPVGAPAGMLLSGGMDSRVLLAILADQINLSTFPTFTWGIPGCDDARAAREVARHLGAPNHFYELKPDWLLSFADECVRITDGMGNLINLHARATLDQETQHAPILYKGFLGDAMMGYAQQHIHWADYDPDTAIRAHMQVHRNQGVITFGPEEHDSLFTPSFRSAVGAAVMDAYAQGMAESNATLLADQRVYFDYRQRVPRHTLNGVQVTRSRAVVRLPFVDNDLIDLMLQVPPGLRYQRRIMRDAFIRDYPRLARIPLPDTGLPMLDSARDIWLRTQRWLRWHIGRVTPLKMDYFNFKPYKDYDTWFRTILRPWVEGVLLDERTLARGYFQPDYLRNIVHEHMRGQNHTVRLGAFLTLELWHRQFID